MNSSTALPSLSVIICAYTENRWDDLQVAIASVQRQTLPAKDIVLVIDHNPKLLAMAQATFLGKDADKPGFLKKPGLSAQATHLTIIENSEARGLSGARNSGIAASTGDVIAFMDEDAEATDTWLATLAAHYANDTVMGVGGSIHPRWMNANGKPAWFPEEFNWVVGCTYKGMPEQPTPVRNLIGCNMSLRREVFEQAGNFRIGRVGALSIGMENDDTEICIRAQKAFPKHIFLYDPAVRVVNHRVPDSRRSFGYFAKRCLSEGISKARLSKKVGSQQGLASERTHALKVLPQGVLAGLKDALKGDLSGALRAGTIVSGFMVAGVGLVYGNLRGAANAQDEFDKRVGNGLTEMED